MKFWKNGYLLNHSVYCIVKSGITSLLSWNTEKYRQQNLQNAGTSGSGQTPGWCVFCTLYPDTGSLSGGSALCTLPVYFCISTQEEK